MEWDLVSCGCPAQSCCLLREAPEARRHAMSSVLLLESLSLMCTNSVCVYRINVDWATPMQILHWAGEMTGIEGSAHVLMNVLQIYF